MLLVDVNDDSKVVAPELPNTVKCVRAERGDISVFPFLIKSVLAKYLCVSPYFVTK